MRNSNLHISIAQKYIGIIQMIIVIYHSVENTKDTWKVNIKMIITQ